MKHRNKIYEEKKRLEEVFSYAILDSLPEEEYEGITRIASAICQTPISLITFLDEERQWFKSHLGMDVKETPRDQAFCQHAFDHREDIFIVNDARMDQRFQNNPLVTQHPKIVFYAGVLLCGDQGNPLGTLCVIDKEPRELNPAQQEALKDLASQVMRLLELRKKSKFQNTLLELLKKKNQELESFASIAAHDIKSPLNNIISLSRVLNQIMPEALPENAQKLIDNIEISADTLKKLVDSLLSYGRSEKVIHQEKELFSMNVLRNELDGLFSHQNLKLRIHTDLKEIIINRAALIQILINLISNALKYNDKPHTEVDIYINAQREGYQFQVSDNGPGISPEDHERIFKMFEILDKNDRFGEKGIGIGLATVKKVVQALGGDISVRSCKGKGACFIFNLER